MNRHVHGAECQKRHTMMSSYINITQCACRETSGISHSAIACLSMSFQPRTRVLVEIRDTPCLAYQQMTLDKNTPPRFITQWQRLRHGLQTTDTPSPSDTFYSLSKDLKCFEESGIWNILGHVKAFGWKYLQTLYN